MVFSQKDFLLLTATLSTLWGSTNSFQISFWGGAQCTSDAEGTFDHDYTSQGTCYPVPINAQSATVESNSPGEGLFSKSQPNSTNSFLPCSPKSDINSQM